MQQNHDIPGYLYHYTNVETLALILKHKAIRFSSLDKMDDLQEQISDDKQNFGKFVFVSSWTSKEDEDIPMWRMYTPKQKGIRIKLAANPFVEYTPTLEEMSKYSDSIFVAEGEAQANFKTIIPASTIFNEKFFLVNYVVNKQLFKVGYEDEQNLLKPKILKIQNGEFTISLNEIGIYKNKYWTFQEEWRYRLMFLPISAPKLMKELDTEMRVLQSLVISGQAALDFNYYDLKIRDDIFNDMSVTLAPDISESSKIYVELLVKEYCPNCKIKKSILTNLIK